MRVSNFERLAGAVPLNGTAAAVRDGSGEHYEGRVPSWHAHWKAPPLPEGRFDARFGGEDLTGREFGKGMRVIRYHRSRSGLGAQWLVRCSCGDYELRATKAIRTAKPDHACQACDWFEHVKWKAAHERAGRTVAANDAARLDELARTGK